MKLPFPSAPPFPLASRFPSPSLPPSSGGTGKLEPSVVSISSLFNCPSLDGSSAAGDDSEEITVVRGVIQSSAWMVLRSHYCNQMHP